MKKVITLFSILLTIFISCKKENNNLNSSDNVKIINSNATLDHTVALPNYANGMLVFSDFDHIDNFLEQNSTADLIAIYSTLGFANNNLSNTTLMDSNNLQHLSYRVLNTNNTIQIGDYLCKLTNNGIYFITTHIDDYSPSDFETATFDNTTMKKFAVFFERDSTFSLTDRMHSAIIIDETYPVAIDPNDYSTWMFWGKKVDCHIQKIPHPYIENSNQCIKTCTTTYYRFGIKFVDPDKTITIYACD